MFKFLTEIAPLIAFFIGYKTSTILDATLYLLIATIISTLITYLVTKKLNKASLLSVILLLISASLTLFSGSSIFIKMKPTLLYLVFALILFYTQKRHKVALEYLLGSNIHFAKPEYWRKLNLRFACFFILMSILNELIWRNFSEDLWVNFKVFGAMPITLIFVAMQLPFIVKHSLVINDKKSNIKEEN